MTYFIDLVSDTLNVKNIAAFKFYNSIYFFIILL